MRDGGLQPERTSLAWTRTSLAVLANGALLFVKDVDAWGGWWWTAGILTAAVIGGLVLAIGMRRQRALRTHGAVVAPRREIMTAGLGIMLLIVTVASALFG